MAKQALACGRPLISNTFGGISEFFDSSVGYPVSHEYLPADDYYTGLGLAGWSNLDEIVEAMRYIYLNRDEVKSRGYRASELAPTYSSSLFSQRMLAILREVGALR